MAYHIYLSFNVSLFKNKKGKITGTMMDYSKHIQDIKYSFVIELGPKIPKVKFEEDLPKNPFRFQEDMVKTNADHMISLVEVSYMYNVF